MPGVATSLCLHALTGRAAQVKGRGPSDQYIVFPGHYCSCHSFFWDVVSRKHAIYVSLPEPTPLPGPALIRHLTPQADMWLLLQCKHQLAARAAQATRRCPISRIPDDILARMLMAA